MMQINQLCRISTQCLPALLLGLGLTGQVHASTFIDGVKVEPNAAVQPGQVVTVTVLGTEGDLVNCGLKVHLGDGTAQEFKIVKKGTLPIKIEHKYVKPGEYKVMAEPKKVTSHLKCGGQNQTAIVKVVAPAAVAAAQPQAPVPVAAAPAAAKAASPVVTPKPSPAPAAKDMSCPDGWNLDTKTANKATGSYTCTAKVGASLPKDKLPCRKGMGYYENPDKGLIGCRP
jgi:hypothetical protein